MHRQGRKARVRASIKSSCEHHHIFGKTLSARWKPLSSSLVEHGVEHCCPDREGSPYRPSAPGVASLLVAARFWCLGWSHLQPRGLRLSRSRPRHAKHDYRWNWSLLRLHLSSKESSRVWARGVEGSEQARNDRNGVLRYLDDLYDDSTVYCSKSASFLAGSFFSSVAGGGAGLTEDGVFIDDRSVT